MHTLDVRRLTVKRHLLAAALFIATSATASAQTLDMPAEAEALGLPQRGLDMATVESRYGAPVRVIEAVGEPPITRWVYPDYTVYFEHQFVIHPVVRTSHTGHTVQP